MKLNEIAQLVGLKCDNDIKISGLNSLLDATQSELTFLENKKYVNDLKNTNYDLIVIDAFFNDELLSKDDIKVWKTARNIVGTKWTKVRLFHRTNGRW